MLCCGNILSSPQISILQNPERCRIHKQNIRFICLDNDPKCESACLLCNQCLIDHQEHDWRNINDYFSQQFRDSLRKGTSLHGQKVSKLAKLLQKQIQAMKKKINQKIDEFAIDMVMQFEELKALYPLDDKFNVGLGYNLLTNQNVIQFRKVSEREKNGEWVANTESFLLRMIKQSSLMISNFFDDLHSHVSNRDYTSFTQQTSQMLGDSFMKKYENVFTEDTRYFKFNIDERHVNIRVSQDEREARYVKGSGKPTCLTKNSLNNRHSIIYFQVMRLDKTMIVFDKQLIIIGVCMPSVIKIYGYKAIMQPSHGGFGIGSSGKTYHSKLLKYEKAETGFTFGEEDIVSVALDFETKILKFVKMTGFFKKEYQMELGIQDDEVNMLKPFVMFEGEEGAIVRILEEYETTITYQRKLKQRRKERTIKSDKK